MRSRTLILDYLRKHWIRYIAGIFIVVISTYSGTLLPRYLGRAIDGLNSADIDIGYIKQIAVIMGVIALISFATRFIWRYLIFGFCRKIEFYLRETIFRHLQKLSVDFYIKNNTGDIITRSIVDVQAVRMMFGFATVAMIDAVITTVMSVINMSSSTNFMLTLLVIAPIPFLIYVILKVKKMVKTRYTKVAEAISDISSKVQENITGIRVMKAFSQEEKESAAFDILSRKKVDAEMRLAKAAAIIGPTIGLTFGIVFSVFLVIGGSLVAKKTITLGDYVAFNSYLLLIVGPVSQVGRIVDRWQRGTASLKRLDMIMLEKPSIDDSKADIGISELETGRIRADNLSFFYETGAFVVNDLSFDIPSGGSLAIMGPTGCGKTTIAGLLMRIWGCDDGMLFIDGKDINTIPLKVLRRNCAYVPQDSFLFSDTIMENIRFYDKNITDEQVIAAAKEANVHDNIMGFPAGYETTVGERGMTLSGGQKQRIALARALVRSPKILLLDDCMSAVDSATEKNIVESLKNRLSHCTMVIITHRLSAAYLTDNILLLDNDGKLDEYGNHETLMKNQGNYYAMVKTMEAGDELCQNESSGELYRNETGAKRGDAGE
ncbi:MAG: ABC transporter ATP-binding protein [Saccharofermentanales bacterium]